MILQTVVRDCLYVNWAVPSAALPALPDGLRAEEHEEAGERFAFVSLVCFRQERLHHELAPFLNVSYPQCNLRLYVRDGEGVAAVYFLRMLVPAWVVAGARLVGHQPARPAALDFPPPGLAPPAGPWAWRIDAGRAVALRAEPGAGAPGPGPDLGSWQRVVAHFRERPRGYALQGGKLRSVESLHPTVEHVPVRVEVESAELAAGALPGVEGATWSRPHSAFLCPRVPFLFELGGVRDAALPARAPAPS